jgi:hypothetical protein
MGLCSLCYLLFNCLGGYENVAFFSGPLTGLSRR